MFAYKLNTQARLILICLVSALGGLLFGIVTAVIAGAAPLIAESFHLNHVEVGILVSSLLIGAGIGAATTSVFIERFGRKITLFACAAIYLISAWGVSHAEQYYTVLLFRFITGIGLGVSSFTVPMYISEIAPWRHRGQFVMLNSMALTGGMVLGYGLNIYFGASNNWHAMFAFAIYPAALFALGMLLLPESPRWLLAHKQDELAYQVMKALNPDDDIEEDFRQIQQSVTETATKWRDLISPNISKVLAIGLTLAFMQHFTGINIILYYAPTLFSSAGFQGNILQLIPLLMGIVNFVMTGVALLTVDRFGRRKLLIKGYQWMILSLVCMVVCFSYATQIYFLAILLIVSCVIFVGSYAMSIGCLFWLLIAEIFPLQLKTKAMGLMTSANWFANFIVSLTFLPLLKVFGVQLTFAFYALACMISLFFVYYFVPETKSVTLEQIQLNLQSGKRIRDIGAPVN